MATRYSFDSGCMMSDSARAGMVEAQRKAIALEEEAWSLGKSNGRHNGHDELPESPADCELAARLYEDAAGYWEARGGMGSKVGECRRLAQLCRKRAEGR